MKSLRKLAQSAAVGLGLLGAVAWNQSSSGAAGGTGDDTIVVSGNVRYLQESNVAALREGVLESLEVHIGSMVERGGTIGLLHNRMARLAVTKAQAAAESVGSKFEAMARKDLAMSVVIRNRRLASKDLTAATKEEVEKAEAELQVALAQIKQADEKHDIDQAELELAKETLDEHTIRAPFPGMIVEQLKHEGESVRANEPIVKIANLDRLRVHAFIPLEHSYRVKPNMIVDVKPRVVGLDLPQEKKRFRGKITFVDPEIQPHGETTRRVFIDVENNAEHELENGQQAEVTIYLNPAAAPPPPADSIRRAATGAPAGAIVKRPEKGSPR